MTLRGLMVPTADPGTEADPMNREDALAEVTRQLGERTGCDPSEPPWSRSTIAVTPALEADLMAVVQAAVTE
jgi:hypothetical protein